MSVDADISFVINPDGSVDVTAKQGATWTFPFNRQNPDGSAMDLSGWELRGQIRQTPTKTGSPTASFDFSGSDLSQGQIVAIISADDSTLVKCGDSPTDDASNYVYDMERYQGTPEIVHKDLPHGKWIVIAEVTK